MDFLDPKKSRAHTIRLFIGYFLLAIAIGLAAMVLYYSAGYSVKEGKVVQTGVVFVSSTPGGAAIYLNGQRINDNTNTRLVLQSGTYTMRLQREGYRHWQRAVTVEGGSDARVSRFDYPLLIPEQLAPVAQAAYAEQPALTTQSPDRRWLVVQPAAAQATFDIYDIRDPKKVKTQKTTASLPASVLTLPTGAGQTFELAEWSRDNLHVLLRHTNGGQTEYIMLRRDKPEESFNLTQRLNLAKTAEVTLLDKKFDRYFVHDRTAHTLGTARLDQPAITPLLSGVLAYKSYSDNVILYAATDTEGQDGKVMAKLYQDGESYPIRQMERQDKYLLDISNFDDEYYAVIGAPADDHVYIYRDAVKRLKSQPDQPLVPVEILKLANPNYLEFSANSRFILAEDGTDLAVFDAREERSHTYALDRPLDAPQTHMTWMDGFHLQLVSQGMVTVLDYDGTNTQTLAAGQPAILPFFDTTYRTLYSVAAAPAGTSHQADLNATSLLTPADQ